MNEVKMKVKECFIIQIIILLFTFTIFHCGDNPTGSSDSITIDIPLNKKAVRAVAYYNSTGNSDSLIHLRISSFHFNSSVTSNDTTFLVGEYERLDSDIPDNPLSGELTLSLTKDWVFFQSSEIFDAGIDLVKPLIITDVDTTKRSPLARNHSLILHNFIVDIVVLY
jgi:hypothetical protein